MNRKQKINAPPETEECFPAYVQDWQTFFGLDVSLVRIIYVFATIFTAFAGTLIYIILLVIIPEEPNRYYQHD